MNRFIVCGVALGVSISFVAIGLFDEGALHEGKVMRLANGMECTVLGRDPHATGWWRVRLDHVGRAGVVLHLGPEDLRALQRGELSGFVPVSLVPAEDQPRLEVFPRMPRRENIRGTGPAGGFLLTARAEELASVVSDFLAGR